MFKNRSLQVKMVKDETLEPVSSEYFELDAGAVSDAIITVVNETSKTLVKVMAAYIFLDTWRKCCINLTK